MTIRINGELLPPQAIEYEFGRLVRFYSEHMPEAEVRKQAEALKEKAKQQAIGAKLLIDEASRLDLAVPEAAVAEKFSELVAGCGGRAAFDKMLAARGTSEQSVRAGILQGCRVDVLVARITGDVADPSEAEIRAHFESHREEYTRPPRVSARHILVECRGGGEAERATARAKIEQLRRTVAQGGDFAEQAALHSDCPSGKQSGGSLGWFSPGMMVPEFDKAVFSMRVDELSQVVETQFGFHIIQKTGAEEGGAADFDDVREQVREFLRHAARGAAIAAHVAELRAKARIEES